jgi:hypothetical protein
MGEAWALFIGCLVRLLRERLGELLRLPGLHLAANPINDPTFLGTNLGTNASECPIGDR